MVRGSGARPALQENVSNLEQYDTVFLGYPNWWYGAPMALLSFLEQNDLSGKDVYLFCSHGTGGLAGSVEQIVEAAPDAVISDNIFDCYEVEAASSEAASETASLEEVSSEAVSSTAAVEPQAARLSAMAAPSSNAVSFFIIESLFCCVLLKIINGERPGPHPAMGTV